MSRYPPEFDVAHFNGRSPGFTARRKPDGKTIALFRCTQMIL